MKRINPATGLEEEIEDPKLGEEGDAPQGDESPEDIEFKKQLEVLEQLETEQGKPKRTPLEKAQFTLESVKKQIRKFGGNPDATPDKKPEGVSQADFDAWKEEQESKQAHKEAESEARKLVKSEEELKVVMALYERGAKTGNVADDIENAHLIANKGKMKRTQEEIARAGGIQRHQGGGFGQRQPAEGTVPELSAQATRSIQAAGMEYDPQIKAYVGKKVRLRFDGAKWVSELNSKGKWKAIPNASDFDQS